uniref:Uncharacterized protein n=1 Tax=Arundo donax TaxID=35708 RepID=A0A0A9BLM6_ARUDO
MPMGFKQHETRKQVCCYMLGWRNTAQQVMLRSMHRPVSRGRAPDEQQWLHCCAPDVINLDDSAGRTQWQ